MSDGSAANSQSYQGSENASTAVSDFSTLSFLAEQAVSKVFTGQMVKIVKVTNTPGKLDHIGTVDVLPLVNQVDGRSNATKHQVVHKLTYFRYQGGRHAVIIDPKVDDIGFMIVADRDTSSVIKNKDQANPGSLRRFDLADGIFVGMNVSKEVPEQYVRLFEADNKQGIQIHDKNGNDVLMNDQGTTITDKSGNKIVMSSTGINLNP